MKFCYMEEILLKIDRIRKEKGRLIAAIDGRCASGKTTLAEELRKALACNVFHMDEFFLRPEQRTEERYEEPGGNVDRERFFEEVLCPALKGERFFYRPFDCHSMKLKEPVAAEPAAVTVVEGTYSCHPMLWDNYDLHIFLTTSPEEQLSRIKKRESGNYEMFLKRWIPLEEKYFKAYSIEERCELRFIT